MQIYRKFLINRSDDIVMFTFSIFIPLHNHFTSISHLIESVPNNFLVMI